MNREKQVIEDTISTEHFMWVFVCGSDERDNVLALIKAEFPGQDIEVTKTGYKVRVLRKKSEAEKQAFFNKTKPKTEYDQLFDKGNKRGKK